MTEKVRVRIAPSPTGSIHVGNMRSALFNWVFARKSGGAFVLRIEDTDMERSTQEYEEIIYSEMKWVGLEWDEGPDVGGPFGPYRQSERLDTYEKYAKILIDRGLVYECYCTPEELEREREAARKKGRPPRYSGRCLNLSAAEKEQFRREGRKPALRFKVPEDRVIAWNDAVRGELSFKTAEIGDFIIMRPDGIPVYNFAVVIDDYLMQISHVLRGEEHISNTPRQILLYEALGFTVPTFGHLPVVLAEDRTKLSKRIHKEALVKSFRERGYLPEAMFNFLALLGWSPEGEREIMSRQEIIESFELTRVVKSGAVFDVDKLNWINQQYIREADPDRLVDMAEPFLRKAGYEVDRNWLREVIINVRERLTAVEDITSEAEVLLVDTVKPEDEEAQQALLGEHVPRVLETFLAELAEIDQLDYEAARSLVKGLRKKVGLSGRQVFMPLRVALTGATHGPELVKLIPLLGQDKCEQRVKMALTRCCQNE